MAAEMYEDFNNDGNDLAVSKKNEKDRGLASRSR